MITRIITSKFNTRIEITILFSMLIALILLAYHFLQPRQAQQTNKVDNISQFLSLLNVGLNKNPLTILRISGDSETHIVDIEVAASFDVLKEYNYLRNEGKIDLIINKHATSTYNWLRATNGNLLLEIDMDEFSVGTNYVNVELMIFDPSNRDHMLIADGPTFHYVFSTNAP